MARCRRRIPHGWLYVLPGVGPNGNLVKVGQSRWPIWRTLHLWESDPWRMADRRDPPDRVWVTETLNRNSAEMQILSRLGIYRTFFRHPSTPHDKPCEGWTEMFDVNPQIAVSLAVEITGNEPGVITPELWRNVDLMHRGGLRHGSFMMSLKGRPGDDDRRNVQSSALDAYLAKMKLLLVRGAA